MEKTPPGFGRYFVSLLRPVWPLLYRESFDIGFGWFERIGFGVYLVSAMSAAAGAILLSLSAVAPILFAVAYIALITRAVFRRTFVRFAAAPRRALQPVDLLSLFREWADERIARAGKADGKVKTQRLFEWADTLLRQLGSVLTDHAFRYYRRGIDEALHYWRAQPAVNDAHLLQEIRKALSQIRADVETEDLRLDQGSPLVQRLAMIPK